MVAQTGRVVLSQHPGRPPDRPDGFNLLGASLTFTDATINRRLQEELQVSHKELEVAYEELQSTNEELETINEELQSTVEELETTNEELQSTNEELETMNEELQSTNEEVEAANTELNVRGVERDRINTFLNAILTSIGSGVVVVDHDLNVQVWNEEAEDLWGLRFDEVRDKNLFGLDIGLRMDEIRLALRACMAGESAFEERTIAATNRRGRAIQCKDHLHADVPTRRNPTAGAVLLMENLDASRLQSSQTGALPSS